MTQQNDNSKPSTPSTVMDPDQTLAIVAQILALLRRLTADGADRIANIDDDLVNAMNAMHAQDGNFGIHAPGGGALGGDALGGDHSSSGGGVAIASAATNIAVAEGPVGKAVEVQPQATPVPLCGSGASAAALAETHGVSGFVCAGCHQYNLIRPARETWYCITAGRRVGVFQGWHEVQPLVSGVRNACFRRYGSRGEADAAFEAASANGDVRVIGE